MGEGPASAALPPLTSLRVLYEAENPGTLPPLPTTSFHGALAKALWREVCLAPARPACLGCPAQPQCAYARLFEPAVDPESSYVPGVTTEPPRPLVLAPDPPHLPTGRAPIRVAAGDPVAFRLVLVGPPQGVHMSLIRALRLAGRQGLGNGRFTVRLRMLDAGRERPAGRSGSPGVGQADIAPRRATLHLVTPLRLKAGGRVVSELNALSLVDAMIRRVRLLASVTGTAWEPPFDPKRVAAALRVSSSLRLLPVRRHSARQGRRMGWPGLVGEVHLSGLGLAPLWPLVRFCEKAQLGKGTTFGFGRYEVVLPRHRRAGAARRRF